MALLAGRAAQRYEGGCAYINGVGAQRDGLGDIATIMAVAVFLSVVAIAANAVLLWIDRAIPR